MVRALATAGKVQQNADGENPKTSPYMIFLYVMLALFVLFVIGAFIFSFSNQSGGSCKVNKRFR